MKTGGVWYVCGMCDDVLKFFVRCFRVFYSIFLLFSGFCTVFFAVILFGVLPLSGFGAVFSAALGGGVYSLFPRGGTGFFPGLWNGGVQGLGYAIFRGDIAVQPGSLRHSAKSRQNQCRKQAGGFPMKMQPHFHGNPVVSQRRTPT